MFFVTAVTLVLMNPLVMTTPIQDVAQPYQEVYETETTPSDVDMYGLSFSTKQGRIEPVEMCALINDLDLTPVEVRVIVHVRNTKITMGIGNPGTDSKEQFIQRVEAGLSQAVDTHNASDGLEIISINEVMKGYYFTMIRFEDTSLSMKKNMERIVLWEKRLREKTDDLTVSLGSKKVIDDALNELCDQPD